jgi:hypothetical protein
VELVVSGIVWLVDAYTDQKRRDEKNPDATLKGLGRRVHRLLMLG